MVLKFYAEEKDKDRTVYSVLRRELRISATMLRRLKSAGVISVGGESVFTNYKLSPGETLEVDIDGAEQPCDNLPQYGKLEILFENEGLLAVNKPSGILVHPSRSRHLGTLSNFVAGYLAGVSEDFVLDLQQDPAQPSLTLPPQVACHAVNRLDRDTSGVVLFAKNSYMKDLASKALGEPEVKKEYLALVAGKMPDSGTIDAPIKRLEERNMFRIVSADGQRAVTHFETLENFDDFSLVKFRLETGRTHQIRVHCRHMGHPIIGDKLYCNDEALAISRALGAETQALHAKWLSFIEPLSGQHIEITAPWKVPIDVKNFPCIL